MNTDRDPGTSCSLEQVWPCQSTLSDMGTVSREDGQGLLSVGSKDKTTPFGEGS